MLVGGQTSRASSNYHRLSTIIDYHAPFDHGLKASTSWGNRSNDRERESRRRVNGCLNSLRLEVHKKEGECMKVGSQMKVNLKFINANWNKTRPKANPGYSPPPPPS